jgi:hypothetical protein
LTGTTCPRCHGPLPETVVRALAGGATCPFCSVSLKRLPGQTAVEVSSDSEGFAPLQVKGAPAQSKPAPPASPAASTASKSLRSTIVGTAAIRTVTAAGPAAPARGSAAAAVARTVAAPAPVRTPSARPAVAPAAARPPRTLTPAQALDLPTPTPAPVLTEPLKATAAPIPAAPPPKAPPALAPGMTAPRAPTPAPVFTAPLKATVMPQRTDRDSEPIKVQPPASGASQALDPAFELADSEAVFESVTMTAEEPSVTPPPAPLPSPLTARSPLAPTGDSRRNLAIIGVGMGLAIVGVAFAGVKLLGAPKRAPAPVVAQAAPPAPEPEPVVAPIEVPAPAPQAPPSAAAEVKPSPRSAAAKHEASVPSKRERAVAANTASANIAT